MDRPWRIHAVTGAAIGKAIEEELGNRKGQRTDLLVSQAGVKLSISRRSVQASRSAESFERAKTVVERGTPEVQAAMDSGELSVSAARQ